MAKPIYHALRDGRPLCGFTQESFTFNWPEGHVWTYPTDFAHISCGECKELAPHFRKLTPAEQDDLAADGVHLCPSCHCLIPSDGPAHRCSAAEQRLELE